MPETKSKQNSLLNMLCRKRSLNKIYC